MITTCRVCGRTRYIKNKTHCICGDCNKIRNKRLHPEKLTVSQKFNLKYPNYGFNNQVELFKHIWETRPHISYISGRPIPEFDIRCFAHVLSKKQYPAFRHYPKNIVLITAYEHNLFDQGTAGRRMGYLADWDALGRLVDELKTEYALQSKSLTWGR